MLLLLYFNLCSLSTDLAPAGSLTHTNQYIMPQVIINHDINEMAGHLVLKISNTDKAVVFCKVSFTNTKFLTLNTTTPTKAKSFT